MAETGRKTISRTAAVNGRQKRSLFFMVAPRLAPPSTSATRFPPALYAAARQESIRPKRNRPESEHQRPNTEHRTPELQMPKITMIGAGSTVFAKNLLGDILSFP